MSNSLRPHGLQHTRLPCPGKLDFTNFRDGNQVLRKDMGATKTSSNTECLTPWVKALKKEKSKKVDTWGSSQLGTPSPCAVLCLVAQLRLTLCNLMDYSSPDFSANGNSPGKITGVGCHALLQEPSPYSPTERASHTKKVKDSTLPTGSSPAPCSSLAMTWTASLLALRTSRSHD